MRLSNSLAAGLGALTCAVAQSLPYPTNLIGTWSTKSNQTLTGPGFYNPIKDELIEPLRTGISYSFTGDGYYEEAYFRAIANPTNPQCPSGIMQWQHGSYTFNANGSLTLTPIAVDGRQLLSEPCNYQSSIYTRYNQSEYFQRYAQYQDPYHNIPRLDLYQFNGAPLQPMYLVYSPPEMLPTTTLNAAAAASATSSPSGAAARKRALAPEQDIPANWHPLVQQAHLSPEMVHRIDAQRLWWVGLGFTGVGGLLYFGPRRLGIRI